MIPRTRKQALSHLLPADMAVLKAVMVGPLRVDMEVPKVDTASLLRVKAGMADHHRVTGNSREAMVDRRHPVSMVDTVLHHHRLATRVHGVLSLLLFHGRVSRKRSCGQMNDQQDLL